MDLTFFLTEDCNLRCHYCYQKSFRPTTMPMGLALRAMEQALEHGATFLSLTFFGGEPLLRADTLFEVLAAARRLEKERTIPVTAKVATNGLLLNDETIALARQLGLFISLSFDGLRPAQDAGRLTPSGESSFDIVDRSLRRLVAAAVPFGVYSVVTPANVPYLAASRRYFWEAGARILVSAIDYTGSWDETALATLLDQYRKLGDLYREMLAQRGYTHLEPFDSRISQRTRTEDYQKCCPGVRQLSVGPDGTLYGCVEYFYRRLLPLGTVADWLDPEQVKALSQARSGRPAQCEPCGINDRCNYSCDCINLRVSGSPQGPPLSLCQTEQAAIIASDTLASSLYRRHDRAFLVRHYSQSYSMLMAMEKLLNDLEDNHEQAATC